MRSCAEPDQLNTRVRLDGAAWTGIVTAARSPLPLYSQMRDGLMALN
jgi:hypothetical protein